MPFRDFYSASASSEFFVMNYTDLNAAGGIGANCALLEIGPFNVLVDAGFDPKKAGNACLPDFHRLRDKDIHLIILTHCHLDHLGAIPIAMRYHPQAWLLMSLPSQKLYERMLHNSVNIMSRQRDELRLSELPLYTHSEIDRLKGQVVTMQYGHTRRFDRQGETLEVSCHQAGHVPGAAGVRLIYKRKRIFLTGDCLFTDQKVVPAARFPKEPVDVLITETTRGANARKEDTSRATEVRRFIEDIRHTLTDGGSVFIPAFAFGRMQEIFALLNEQQRHGSLPKVPVFGSGLGLDLVDYFDEIARKTGAISFRKAVVKELGVRPLPQKIRPGRPPWPTSAIYVLSSGMMVEETPSYTVASCLLSNPKNLFAFVGYCDPTTPGGKLLDTPLGDRFTFNKLDYACDRNAHIERYDLSGHADREELLELAKEMSPRQIILTHGENEARQWFSDQFAHHLPTTQVLDPVPGERYTV